MPPVDILENVKKLLGTIAAGILSIYPIITVIIGMAILLFLLFLSTAFLNT